MRSVSQELCWYERLLGHAGDTCCDRYSIIVCSCCMIHCVALELLEDQRSVRSADVTVVRS